MKQRRASAGGKRLLTRHGGSRDSSVSPPGVGRPAVLIVAATCDALGDVSLGSEVDGHRRSPGVYEPAVRGAVAELERLLPAARKRGVPVVYLTGPWDRPYELHRCPSQDTVGRSSVSSMRGAEANVIPSRIEPEPGDFVSLKGKQGAFVGTRLAELLVDLQVDTLLMAGLMTSRCLRDMVACGLMFNYRVAVVAECTAHQGGQSHANALAEMPPNVSDVYRVEDAISHFRALPPGLFEGQIRALGRSRASRRVALLRGAASL